MVNFVRTSAVALAMAAMVGFSAGDAAAQEALTIAGPGIGHVAPGYYPGCSTGLYGGGIYGGGYYGGVYGGYYPGYGTVYPGINHGAYYPGTWHGGVVTPGLIYCPVRGWGRWH
ncbi:MAG: hypothetical protein AAF456_14890 [Planctomycetota bacterium]